MKKGVESGQFQMADLSGKKFNMLTALFPSKFQHGSYYWRCKCECGNENDVIATRLINLKQISCGCLRYRKGQNIKHGLKSHPLYSKWNSMKGRCHTETYHNYNQYGGRGIKVCDRWRYSVENFYNDMITGWQKGLHLDRIDVNGNYCPENCRWVTNKTNQRNKRKHVYITMDGRTHIPTEWAEIIGTKANTICKRKQKGWTDFEALFGLK